MASVAVPMLTSFAIGKVGEAMDLDPRLTAVLSAAGGYGAGTAWNSYSGAQSINAANTAATAANVDISKANMLGDLDYDLNILNQNRAGQAAWRPVTNVATRGGGQVGIANEPFKPQAIGGYKPKPLQEVGADTTMGEQWDSLIKRDSTRPVDDQGKPTGELSYAENLGAEMLSTVLTDLPEEQRQHMAYQGGYGGSGGAAAPYRGGGGFVERKVVSNLAGNRERRFQPQGI
jgi:hypothetical protein